MSTLPPTDASVHVPTSAVASGPAAEPDPQLIQETRNQIREIVNEITRLSQSDLAPADFYREFLQRVVSALASIGGAVWLQESGTLKIQQRVNLPATLLDAGPREAHARLVEHVVTDGQPVCVPPHSASAGDEATNPTDCLLLFAPLSVDDERVGLVEVFQRSGGGPTTQRGYLRFVVQMCDLAAGYLKSRRLRQYTDQQAVADRADEFARAVHRRLDLGETCFAIVNEGRRALACDRASIAARHGRRYIVTAVSGVENIDRRASEVRLMQTLAARVAAVGEPLWYRGAGQELPPQLETAVQNFVDHTHAKSVAVLPLRQPTSAGEPDDRPVGVLILEQRGESHFPDALLHQSHRLAVHAGSALANALQHDGVFLMPLWRAVGQAKCVMHARHLPKTLLLVVALAAGIAGLVLGQANFDLAARGKLRPVSKRDVFAPEDGVVTRIGVTHGEAILPGQHLATLRNTDLELRITELVGRRITTREQIHEKEQTLLKNPRLTPLEENQLNADLLHLRQVDKNLTDQLALHQQKKKSLVVSAAHAGQIMTWQVADRLQQRPVTQGQVLMSVFNPDGAWRLELDVPERRIGHLMRATAAGHGPLAVTYTLSTHPGQQFQGQVEEIHRTVTNHGDDGNTVLVRVSIDKSSLPELRPNTTVTARFHCGRRALGYVWLHELLETVQTKLLFWF